MRCALVYKRYAFSSTDSIEEAMAGAAGARQYFLRFGASKLEADLEGVFLTKGGTLGGAAARGDTDFALTYSDRSTPRLLTERHELVDVPLSDKLVQTSSSLFSEETGGAALSVSDGPPVLLLSDRTQVLVTSMRTGASINGTNASSMAGTASVPLHSLFATIDSSKLLQGNSDIISHRVGVGAPPFSQIAIKYPNWEQINATVGINAPVVFYIDEKGIETPISVAFFTPSNQAARLQAVEPILKSIYDVAWSMTETVPFVACPSLTKSVTRKSYGFNGSNYSLACEVNDTPISTTAETLESVMAAALEIEMQGTHNHAQVLADLATPSFAHAVNYSKRIVNALSAFAAFTMPYRVDGTPVIAPNGVQMVQSESWPVEPTRLFAKTADDCDGSCQQQVSVVRFSSDLNADPSVDMNRFPNLRAIANSIGAHYVYGTSVLAANAGHASAANEAAVAVAGHAIMLAIPKPSILTALERGSMSTIAGGAVVEPKFVNAVTAARFNALYPRDLVAKMPESEQALFATHQSMVGTNIVNPVTSLQPLAGEGTTFAKSTLYTHDPTERVALKEFFIRDKQVSESMSPNVTRTAKSLDVGLNGAHSFYGSFVELGLSLKSPLFTDPTLRALGHATPHLRFAKSNQTDAITEAGASPKDLAIHAFSVVPLWKVGSSEAALIDEASVESIANTMPMRGTAIQLSENAVNDLNASLASLKDLNDFLHAEGKAEHAESHETAHVVSFAALLHNQKAIESFCEMVKSKENTYGEIYGLETPVIGLAVAASDPAQQLGRFVTVELMVQF